MAQTVIIPEGSPQTKMVIIASGTQLQNWKAFNVRQYNSWGVQSCFLQDIIGQHNRRYGQHNCSSKYHFPAGIWVLSQKEFSQSRAKYSVFIQGKFLWTRRNIRFYPRHRAGSSEKVFTEEANFEEQQSSSSERAWKCVLFSSNKVQQFLFQEKVFAAGMDTSSCDKEHSQETGEQEITQPRGSVKYFWSSSLR